MKHGPERDALMRQLYADGATPKEIARRVGLSRWRTYWLLSELGIYEGKESARDPLLEIYKAAMRGDHDWSTVRERPREERVRLILADLRREAENPERNPKAILRAISLWEQTESLGPRALEVIQRAHPNARRRVA